MALSYGLCSSVLRGTLTPRRLSVCARYCFPAWVIYRIYGIANLFGIASELVLSDLCTGGTFQSRYVTVQMKWGGCEMNGAIRRGALLLALGRGKASPSRCRSIYRISSASVTVLSYQTLMLFSTYLCHPTILGGRSAAAKNSSEKTITTAAPRRRSREWGR